jgi:tetratricopeptide (TPR) repeat protein
MASGRNDPCPCGSGAKYKKCCGQVQLAAPGIAPARPTLAATTLPLRAAHEELTAAEGARISARIAAGEFAALEQEARALAAQRSHSGLAWKALGLALMMQDKDALAALERAAALRPNDPEVHLNLGNALQNFDRHEEAIGSYRRAIAIAPGFADVHNNLGTLYRQQGQARAAEDSCRRALQLNPRSAAATALLAALHADNGQFAEAESLCRQALALDPNSPQPLADLAHLRRMSADDASWLVEAQRLLRQGLPMRREAYLRYAMGKYFDDLQEYPSAFENFQRANELTKQFRPRHDRAGLTHAVDRAIGIFNPEWFERMRSTGQRPARPVFIVGMPRSGTSLAEQILASHPEVYGAGELNFWSNRSPPDPASISRSLVDSLAADYLQLLQQLSVDGVRVIDKMPTNFQHLGLIHAALPDAKIICMRRDPIDTCLSIYFQNLGPLHTYAYDLEDLVHYYREHRRLMQHWRSVLPATTLLELPYEDLVADPDSWSRAMVSFIGLPWDPRCLDFHLTQRTVITASKWQVRQKISRASVARWRNYRAFIAPLLALGADTQK